MAWALPVRHMLHAEFSSLDFGFGMQDREVRDIDADLCGQGFHLAFVADEGGLDEAFCGGFNGASQRNIGQRPADSGGDGGQGFAALKKLMEDVVVGWMADEGVDGDGFGKGGKIAHEWFSPLPTRDVLSA